MSKIFKKSEELPELTLRDKYKIGDYIIGRVIEEMAYTIYGWEANKFKSVKGIITDIKDDVIKIGEEWFHTKYYTCGLIIDKVFTP